MSFLRTGIAGDRRDIAAIAQRRRDVAAGHGAPRRGQCYQDSGERNCSLAECPYARNESRSCSVGRVPAIINHRQAARCGPFLNFILLPIRCLPP